MDHPRLMTIFMFLLAAAICWGSDLLNKRDSRPIIYVAVVLGAVLAFGAEAMFERFLPK